MSKEEMLCAALDNTSLNEGGANLLKNSNTHKCVVRGKELYTTPSDNGEDCDDLGLEPKNIDAAGAAEISDQEYLEEYEEEDVMTGSYGEISLDQELIGCSSTKSRDSQSDEKISCPSNDSANEEADDEKSKEKQRPDSLVLLKNTVTDGLEAACRGLDQVHRSQQTSSLDGSPSLCSEECDILCSAGGEHAHHVRSSSNASGLSELQGTLTVDGDMVMFVAEDLQEKIKMSSPVSKYSASFPGSRSSTPSLYRQALQPNTIHSIDPTAIMDLEEHAKKVATCVDTMLENLTGTLQSISSLTVDCMETYEKSVCKTCDAVDANIKAVYQLMAKCEEMSNSMGPLYRISDDIKTIKRKLDLLENIAESKS